MAYRSFTLLVDRKPAGHLRGEPLGVAVSKMSVREYVCKWGA